MFERYFGTTTKLHVLPQGRSKTKTPFHQNFERNNVSNVLPNNFQQEHFAPLFLYTAGTIKKTPQLLRQDISWNHPTFQLAVQFSGTRFQEISQQRNDIT